MKREYNDLPREQLMKRAAEILKQFPAAANPKVHFKFTCEKCGERCILTEPNVLYENGDCWKCGHKTKITKGGFLLDFILYPP